MKTFNVTFEIEVDAETPLEAAKIVEDWLHNPNDHWQYYVQQENNKKVFSVDLDENDESAVLLAYNYIPIIK